MEFTAAVERGLDFLRKQQLPSGQFPIELTRPAKKGDAVTEGLVTILDESPFATAHIVYSLGFLPEHKVQSMITRALDYFQFQMSGHGLWNYWNKNAMWGPVNMYKFEPADMDDTSNISYLLTRYGRHYPENRDILVLNRDRNGLFYTWFMLRPTLTTNLLYWRTVISEIKPSRFTLFFIKTPARYRDVDGVVNANVLLYLGVRPETENIIKWLIQIVHEGREAKCDKWYFDPFTFYYALSRNYYSGVQDFEEVKPTIISRIVGSSNEYGQIGEHVLHTALAVNALLNFKEFKEVSQLLFKAIDFILKSQRSDGSWESHTYYYGDQVYKWGSAELTTGICLEALQRFGELCTNHSTHPESNQ